MKKINELWDRFRKWLIKKLGGYLDGPDKVETFCILPSIVEARIDRIDRKKYKEDSDYNRRVNNTLADMLGREIIKLPNMVDICEAEVFDPFEPDLTITLRARVRTIPFDT